MTQTRDGSGTVLAADAAACLLSWRRSQRSNHRAESCVWGLLTFTLIAEKSSPEEGPETKENGCQNDRAGTAMMVGETCADVNLLCTSDHCS